MPVFGLGTWRAFDVGSDETARRPLRLVLQRLFDDGGRIIDTSPMYGRAEAVTGDLLAESGARPGVFSRPRCGRQAGSAGSSRCGARLNCCASRPST